ncbi:MAG: glutamate--tRNA ligase, partial [Dehalococcoidia bacterium]|nr:glutamate--tRNA ligase [Dehalococcoidia bacterium]
MPEAMPPRVRYAPSPTGDPHIGNIRAAIFNWLFARHEGGTFVVRIEDTDRNRYVPGALDSILSSLRWLGLDWDEGPEVGGPYGPYFQSERLSLYREAVGRLLDNNFAYECYCSPDRLARVRKEQQRRKEPPKYDRHCRDATRRAEARVASGKKPVVRFQTPLAGETECHDVVRGELRFANETLDDFVLLKSDGYPTYHLANVIDDHGMEISHILRGDEW